MLQVPCVESPHRERLPRLKAYVPYTEEYLRRTELRRNALLADVVQPADQGLAPQQTIANALARRFGGYAHDFFVARYRERDFAIILSGWGLSGGVNQEANYHSRRHLT